LLFNTQSNVKWANDGMGLPADPMKLWGCLVTAIANIYDILPCDLNKWLVQNKGYYGIKYPKQESFLKWDAISKYLNFTHTNDVKDIVFNEKTFNIARIKHRKYGTGHFCNLLAIEDGQYKIFDTDYGDTKLYEYILGVTQIIKN
jgi:hypothetical protein